MHLHLFLLKDASLEAVDLHASLVPLEGVESLGELRAETALDVVVNAEVPFDQVVEVVDDFVGVLVEQSLELAHLFIVVKVLFVLGIKLFEDEVVVLERLDQLFLASLLGQCGCLLQLIVLLGEALVELGKLNFHIVLTVLLLVSYDLEDLIFKFLLAMHGELFELVEHGLHKRRQNLHVLF